MKITLIRHAYLPTCTLGRWYIGNSVLAGLGEAWIPDPDGPGGQARENGKTESCIPDGIYVMRPYVSPRYPASRYVWSLTNPALGVYERNKKPAGQLWGRELILVHNGNTTADILGCELVGLHHGRVDGRDAVMQSVNALDLMRAKLGHDTHELLIRSTRGTEDRGA